jgi:hypothetical protein
MRAEFNVRGGRPDERLHYIMFATEPAEGSRAEDNGPELKVEEESGRLLPTLDDEVGSNGRLAAALQRPTSSMEAAGEAVTDEPSAVERPAAQPAEKTGSTAAGKQTKARRGRKGGGGPARVEIKSFPVGSRLINELMPAVLEACSRNPILKLSLFQV